MSLIGRLLEPGDKPPTRAYGGCTCFCHRNPNVYHIVACCGPGKDDTGLFRPERGQTTEQLLGGLEYEIEVLVEPIAKE